jgi:hypothetical protein
MGTGQPASNCIIVRNRPIAGMGVSLSKIFRVGAVVNVLQELCTLFLQRRNIIAVARIRGTSPFGAAVLGSSDIGGAAGQTDMAAGGGSPGASGDAMAPSGKSAGRQLEFVQAEVLPRVQMEVQKRLPRNP